MKTPHKHAALIKQWADGAEIEYYHERTKTWITLKETSPYWDVNVQYRVKPQKKTPGQIMFEIWNPNCSWETTYDGTYFKSKCEAKAEEFLKQWKEENK